MEKNPENLEWVKDLPLQSEDIGFKPEEMISCRKCGRSNPPTRLNCFYCAEDLEIPNELSHTAKLNLRKLEDWEKGFNIIHLPDTEADDPDIAAIARFLSIENEILIQILEVGKPLPLARIGSQKETEIAVQTLSQLGLPCYMVSDEILAADKFPIRLREIEFADDSLVLTAFNTGEKTDIHRGEIVLIVTGAVFESKTEALEKRKKKQTRLLSETQTTADELLIDIYGSDDVIGYRIPAKGFDFSCLGSDKGLLAGENLRHLTAKLRSFAQAAKLVDDYLLNREALGMVWDIERRKDSYGLQRSGFGKTDLKKVVSSNNLLQFTKYSRLHRHLL